MSTANGSGSPERAHLPLSQAWPPFIEILRILRNLDNFPKVAIEGPWTPSPTRTLQVQALLRLS
jgi:hypothetical protein